MIYGSGTLDVGMTFSCAQVVLDAEIAKMTRRVLQGIPVNPETLAVDIINSVGPNGNFLSKEHTVKHFRDHSTTSLFDRHMRDGWEAEGSREAFEKATEIARDLAKNHKPIPLDPSIVKGLDDILAEAVEEIGMTGWDDVD